MNEENVCLGRKLGTCLKFFQVPVTCLRFRIPVWFLSEKGRNPKNYVENIMSEIVVIASLLRCLILKLYGIPG